jgi:aspartyl-tRNA(Asn)/glutamyl-tRNA(Gln) amidotransferase subunit A
MYEKTRASGFGPEVQRRIMVGTYVLSAGFYDAYYNRARRVRAMIKRDFDTAFASGVDCILAPATPTSAFGLGEMGSSDPVQMYLNDIFTVTLNLAGLPGVVVPMGLDAKGLPLGLQLIGRPWQEADLLNHAYVLEGAAGFVAKAQKWW